MVRRSWRWWFAAAGIVTGFVDVWVLQAFGLRFSVNQHEAARIIGTYFGLSFAALGFLIGELMERRRKVQ